MSGIPYEPAQDRPNEQFVMIHNDRARNVGPVKLHGLAMALHHYLLSLPPGWSTTIDRIADEVFVLDSREKIRQANRELMNAGYVILRTKRDDRGRFVKSYQVFHVAQPEDDRTPSAGKITSRRKTGVWTDQPKREFALVAPDAGKPAAGNTADIKKTDDEDSKKTEKEDALEPPVRAVVAGATKVSRRAHAPRERATLTDQDKINGVRDAIAEVYGDAENEWLADEEVLALFDMKASDDLRAARAGHVNRVKGYFTRIFNDTPDLNTHIVAVDLGTPPMTTSSSDDEQPYPPCPRCGGMKAEIDPNRGVCAYCARELMLAEPPNPVPVEGWNRNILKGVIDALFVTTGKVVDEPWAARVASQILDGYDGRQPATYVKRQIETDWNPKRFLPTPIPPNVRAA